MFLIYSPNLVQISCCWW